MALGPFTSYLPPGVYGPVLGSRCISEFCHCGKPAVAWYINTDLAFDYIIGMCIKHILGVNAEDLAQHKIWTRLTPEEVTVRMVMDE